MNTYDFMVAAKKAVYEWLVKRYAAENKTIAIKWTDVSVV